MRYKYDDASLEKLMEKLIDLKVATNYGELSAICFHTHYHIQYYIEGELDKHLNNVLLNSDFNLERDCSIIDAEICSYSEDLVDSPKGEVSITFQVHHRRTDNYSDITFGVPVAAFSIKRPWKAERWETAFKDAIEKHFGDLARMSSIKEDPEYKEFIRLRDKYKEFL